MVVPEVSPEQTCMLGRFPDVLRVSPPWTLEDTNITDSSRGSSFPISLTKLRETSVVGTISA